MGDTVNFLDQFGHVHATGQSHRQYQVTQPPFKVPAQSIAPKDRYRALRGHDDVYDASEEGSLYDAGIQFDSFGEPYSNGFEVGPGTNSSDLELLRQPYDDRQRQVARGERRLSFAPNRTEIFGGEMNPQKLLESSYQNRWQEQLHDGNHAEYCREQIGDPCK